MRIIDCMKNIFDWCKKKIEEKRIAEEDALSVREERLRNINEGKNLPVVLNKIILAKNEVCHYEGTAWYDTKMMTSSHVKGHGGVSIRIAKGFSVNIGRSKSREVKNEFEYDDLGKLFITNRRIIFTGQKKNFKVTYSNLIAIKPDNKGFELQTEKTNYLVTVKDVKYVNAILNGVFSHIAP